jgi:hypothetical protein
MAENVLNLAVMCAAMLQRLRVEHVSHLPQSTKTVSVPLAVGSIGFAVFVASVVGYCSPDRPDTTFTGAAVGVMLLLIAGALTRFAFCAKSAPVSRLRGGCNR